MEKEVLDITIIGAGPAGICAAIYAKRAGLKFRIFEKIDVLGQAFSTSNIDNYPGLFQISGLDFQEKLIDHLKSLEVKVEKKEVIKINNIKNSNEEYFIIDLKDEKVFSKNVILATGGRAKKLDIINPDNIPILTCATCDGFLYKNKDVIVIGGGNSAFENAIYLKNLASKVILLVRKRVSAEKILIDQIKKSKNVEILYGKSNRIYKENNRIAVEYEKANLEKQLKEKELSKIYVDGIFASIGIDLNIELVRNIVDINKNGEIKVDEKLETKVKNLYAIGDIRENSLKQIICAMSDAIVVIKEIVNKKEIK